MDPKSNNRKGSGVSDLRTFQGAFSAAIRSDSFDGPIGGAADEDAWRFNVYRNSFFHGLIEQLREAYPAVAHMLGDEGFAVVARGYLVYHPPTTRSLALFGAEFPAYIAGISLTQDDAVLCALATLDRAYLESLHAADRSVLDPGGLAALGEGVAEARFVKHPAARIVQSQIPLVDHWRANRGGGNLPNDPSETAAQGALVTRPNLSVQVAALSEAEAAFGIDLFGGKPVSHAFETAEGLEPGFDIAETFRRFLTAGAFTAVTSPQG